MTTTTIDMNARAVERLQAAINAFGQPQIVEQKSEMVEAVIRSGLLLNAIMEEFIQYVYTPHSSGDGYLCITASGYIKRGVVVPWGFNNKATTRSEKHRIRNQFKLSNRKGHAPLFVFDKYRRGWILNIDKYPTLEAAQSWFDVYRIPTQNGTGEAMPIR